MPTALNEAQWQSQVVKVAKLYGWAVHHHRVSQFSEPGWPDLVLCKDGRALFVELKSAKGKVSEPQWRWLGMLSAAGCEVAVWRPDDLPTVTAVLGPRGLRLPALSSMSAE